MFKNKFTSKFIIILIVFLGFFTHSALAGLISTEQEVELGTEAARQLESKYGLSKDPALNNWVGKVGKNLAYIEPREGITYRFKILNMKEPNALAIPGGFIYVTKGIMTDFVKNNEDYLAVVVGHELGHVNERHGMKQLEWSMGLGVLLQVLLGQNSTASDLAELASGLIFLKYSRDQELEADRYGMNVAYKAGYDPRALVTFFKDIKKYEDNNPSSTPEFLASHPDTESRIEEANKYISELSGIPQTDNNYSNDNSYNNDNNYSSDNSGEYNVTGQWESNVASPLILIQNGNDITGTYQNGKGSIEGSIEDNKIEFNWQDYSGEDHGTGYFNISSDGNSLKGEWYSYTGDSGTWKAWKSGSYSSDNNYNSEKKYNISGTWQSNLGEISVAQKGNNVDGYFGKGKGRIKGTVNGNRIEYEWYESVDKEGGTGFFIIAEDEKSMSGTWYSENGASGTWNAYR